ncbi:MAG: hypothetical protein ACOX0D_03405 [Sphaerochaeta sp.]
MLRELDHRSIQIRLVLVRFQDSRSKIVRPQNQRNPFKEFQCMNHAGNPCEHFHGAEGLRIEIVAERECRNEQVAGDGFVSQPVAEQDC